MWGCLKESSDLDLALRETYRVLAPGSPLWFDIAIQDGRDFSTAPKRFSWQTWTSPDQTEIRRRTTLRHDADRQWLALTYQYEWKDPTGHRHQDTVEFGLNTWPLDTYLTAATRAGFDIQDVEQKTFDSPTGPVPMWAFVSLAARHT